MAPRAAALGLGAAWEPLLAKAVVDAEDADAWLRRFLAATEPTTATDLRVVALRMDGLTPPKIARQTGRPRLTRQQVERVCLAVAVRVATDHVDHGWELRISDGVGRRLVFDGVPEYATAEDQAREEFSRLWLTGRPLDDIRASLRLGAAATKRLAAAAPPRWRGREVAAHLGWSRENHRLRMRTDHFPAPDGRDGHSNWWWPNTITTWVATQDLTACPECGARVSKMPQHRKAHGRTRGR